MRVPFRRAARAEMGEARLWVGVTRGELMRREKLRLSGSGPLLCHPRTACVCPTCEACGIRLQAKLVPSTLLETRWHSMGVSGMEKKLELAAWQDRPPDLKI